MNPYEFSLEEKELLVAVTLKSQTGNASWDEQELKKVRESIKSYYIKNQEQTCPYCKVVQQSTNHSLWDTEHIISRDEAPEYTYEPLNLCVSCKDCNIAKGSRQVTKKRGRQYKKFPNKYKNYDIVHPHFDSYYDHIKVTIPGLTYRYKTDKGRKTIEICGLLRYHKVGGRGNVDFALQAVLKMVADDQSVDNLTAVREMIDRSLKEKQP